jgi:lipopolysaccharide transport system permease protein
MTRERIYSPTPELRHPARLLRDMFSDLASSRELGWRLFVRDTAALYRQTALGYFWAVFPPLVSSLVFILLNSANVLNTGDLGMPYPIYVLMGTVFFTLFSDAMSAPLKIVNASRQLLVKVRFPREALILAAVGQTLLSFSIKVALLVVAFVLVRTHVAPTLPLVVIPVAGLLLLGIMAGVAIVPLGALYQDITYGLLIVGNALMFLSPVGFPPPSSGLLGTITHYNPLTPLLLCCRDLVVTGETTYLAASLAIIAVSLVLLGLGWVLFRLAVPIIVERLGS